jgi:hypothetical protein
MGEAEEGPIASETERKKQIPKAQGARQESRSNSLGETEAQEMNCPQKASDMSTQTVNIELTLSDDLRRSISLLNDAYAAVERALYACKNRQALELQCAEDLLELAIAHVKGQQ